MRKVLNFGMALVCLTAFAETDISSVAANSANRLPVRHVVLYKNGVGYFEHSGRVHGNQKVTIDFTTAQLNDVLKSLTAIDLGNGHISDVSYNSTAPLSQRLNSLHLSIGEKTTAAEFLDALRGARVEVRTGAMIVVGRLLSVESRQTEAEEGDDAEKKKLVREDRISLVTDAGELRTFRLSPSTSVRLLERDLNQEVGRYLGMLASTRADDVRRMTLSAAGAGDRDLVVSYISEVPVWKSTYRIVMPPRSDAKPLLQGWAIVDNTVGEDWENVELSLIAGSPQSFIQEISQPYYARRPVVNLPEMAMLNPQTHEQTLDNALLHKPNAGLMDYESMGLASSRDRLENFAKLNKPSSGIGSGSGAGVGSGTGGGMGGGIYRTNSGTNIVGAAAETVAVDAMLENQQITAETKDVGDLFEYKIKQPVTIHKNQSALVPILQARIEAEKVSLWAPGNQRALRALWLTNSSGLTLDRGTFSIQDGETFAGEGLVDPIKPGEKRLISYAADPSVLIESEIKTENERVRRIEIKRGAMMQTEEQRQHKVYTIRNQDKAARTVIIEHPLRKGWELVGDAKPEETTASHYRFRVTVEPEKTTTLAVDEIHSYGSRYEITNLNDEQITLFLQSRKINPEVETALRPIIAQKNEVAGYESQIGSERRKLNGIFDDQKRLRDNLAVLKGNAEERTLAQRYTGELNRQEDQLASLRGTIADLESKRDAAKAKLDAMLQNLTLDTKL